MKKQKQMQSGRETPAVAAPAPQKENKIPLRVLKIFLAAAVVVLIETRQRWRLPRQPW